MTTARPSVDPASVDAAWFDRARFGIFIHVSQASAHGRELSWPMVGGVDSLPSAPLTAFEDWNADTDAFRPAADCADQWCSAAADAGAGYVVIVAKHHDGVANFPSRSPSRQLADGRDLVAEVAAAAARHGLEFGIYFSLSDWGHEDYPAWNPSMAPYSFFSYPRPEPETWARFRAHLLDQIDQLLDHDPRYIWFDGGWERNPDEWGATEIEQLIRSRCPGVLINDRLPGSGIDVTTPEQLIPAQALDGRWEACMTMNRSWGWVPTDHDYSSAAELVWTLTEVVGRGGNLLVNVSPTADGSLPVEQSERLAVVGEWMRRNADAVVGAGPGLEPWQWYGPSTSRDGVVHLVATMAPRDRVVVRGLPTRRVASVEVLDTGRALSFRTRISALDEVLGGDPVGEVIVDVPDEVVDDVATVLAIRFRR